MKTANNVFHTPTTGSAYWVSVRRGYFPIVAPANLTWDDLHRQRPDRARRTDDCSVVASTRELAGDWVLACDHCRDSRGNWLHGLQRVVEPGGLPELAVFRSDARGADD